MNEEAFQRRVAAVALSATMPRGFALAGSGAIREHGLTNRRTADIDLGVDSRGREPVVLAIGAVLREIDAVANKVVALFGRAEARDFLDVDAIRRSGRFTDADLLNAAAEHDAGFDQRVFVDMLRSVQRMGSRRVAEYDVLGPELGQIKSRLLAWADEIERSLEQPA